MGSFNHRHAMKINNCSTFKLRREAFCLVWINSKFNSANGNGKHVLQVQKKNVFRKAIIQFAHNHKDEAILQVL